MNRYDVWFCAEEGKDRLGVRLYTSLLTMTATHDLTIITLLLKKTKKNNNNNKYVLLYQEQSFFFVPFRFVRMVWYVVSRCGETWLSQPLLVPW
jgi:hypothetical protein